MKKSPNSEFCCLLSRSMNLEVHNTWKETTKNKEFCCSYFKNYELQSSNFLKASQKFIILLPLFENNVFQSTQFLKKRQQSMLNGEHKGQQLFNLWRDFQKIKAFLSSCFSWHICAWVDFLIFFSLGYQKQLWPHFLP